MQTMQNLTPATVGTPSYADFLYQQECKHIRDTVHITVSPSLKARDQEIYARTRKIHELEKGDPDVIHAYCNDVVNAEADIGLLLDVMSTLKANMSARDFPAHDRIRIRDDLKYVYFHTHLDNAAANQLYGAIHAISRMK